MLNAVPGNSLLFPFPLPLFTRKKSNINSDYPFVSNSKKCIRSFTSTEVFSVSGTETHSTTLGEGVAFAPSIQLYWKQKDLDEYQTTMATPTQSDGSGQSGTTSQGHITPPLTSS